MTISEMMPVKGHKVNYYKNIQLFYRVDEEFVLYKDAGTTLSEMRIAGAKYPPLYIRTKERITAITEAQKGFNSDIKNAIKEDGRGYDKVKTLLSDVVIETLENGPLEGDNIKGLGDTIKILSKEYTSNVGVLKNLLTIVTDEFCCINHSINVMILTLGYLLHYGYKGTDVTDIGLGALLHDVGKSKISPLIVKAARKLEDWEFEEIKRHPVLGKEMLTPCNLPKSVTDIVVGHHEKVDGSGYPSNKKEFRVGFPNRLVGIVDSYEALTCDDRPYRRAAAPFEALKIIKKDVIEGKFDKEIFEKFVVCLIY